MLNDLDRFHLVMDVVDRVPGLGSRAAAVRQLMADRRVEARAYTREHGEDSPEIRDWTCPTDSRLRGVMGDLGPEVRSDHRSLRVLVLNPGSSTLKAAVIEPPSRDALTTATVEWVPMRPAYRIGRPRSSTS
jgi:hypothetical protein